jgi:predicted transposase YdaD
MTLANDFRSFSPWSIGSGALGPMVRQKTMAESVWYSKAARLMADRKERGRERQRDREKREKGLYSQSFPFSLSRILRLCDGVT